MIKTQPLKSGVLMVASTAKYLEQAKFCFDSLKASNPELPTSLMTFDSQAAKGIGFDLIIEPSPDEELKKYYQDCGRMSSLKTWFLTAKSRLPYELTLYLDIDTFVNSSLAGLFEQFDSSGAAIGYGLNPGVSWKRQEDGSLRPMGLITPVERDNYCANAGILLLRDCVYTYTALDRLRKRYIELSDLFYHKGTDVVNDQSTWREVLSGLAQDQLFIFDSLVYNATPFVWKYIFENGGFDDIAIFHGHSLFNKRHLPIHSILDDDWIKQFPLLEPDEQADPA
jgi:hypothetical protein